MPSTNKDTAYIWGKKKRKWWLIVAIIVIVVALALAGGIFLFGKNTNTNGTAGDSDKKVATTRRAIDGVLVQADQANFFPVAVMIENLVSSRPQSSLAKANLVYEALAEGGITRFMAVYAGRYDVPEIGPVRSARSYFLDWAKELDALYSHVGGSPQSFTQIKKENIRDLDQFFNARYFWRDKGRPAPHNLYTSSELLAFALRDQNVPAEGTYDRWLFKDEAAFSDRPQDPKTIVIDFSTFNYKVEYQYDRDQNDYKRFQAGQLHVDKDGTQVRAKNVVVQYTKTRLVDNERLGMETVGEGDALIFIDGKATQGTWKKSTLESRTRFYDKDGNEILLNAGTTWIEIVPSDRTIVYN